MASIGRRPRIVIIGGGFAGLNAAKTLRGAPFEVTLIDRRNHHLFQPLLYQVATAALAAPDIAAPIREVLNRQRNTTVLLAHALRVDPERKLVELDDGAIGYDYLIVAAGMCDNYFGNQDWAHHAPGLKTLDDALQIRRRILLAFERAERASDEDRRRELLTFAVVGGGPTGVELAGALSEIARRTMLCDFRNIDPSEARVLLLEGADRVLPTFDGDLSRRARVQLEELGVEVRTGARVAEIGDGVITLEGGETIHAATILWGAGVKAVPLAGTVGAAQDRGGRVLVEDDLSVRNHPEIFVVGDMAAVPWGEGTVPGLAPAAIQMGIHAARNIRRLESGRPTVPFNYADRGMLATVGRSRAVAAIGRLKFGGFLAWWLWLVVHIFFLIGFRNRIAVLLDWAFAYVTYQRSSRIILEEPRPGDTPNSGSPANLRRAG
jgi:NADH dehydrogenase